MDSPGRTLRLYVGTYNRRGSEGIYLCRLDLAAGALSEPELVAAAEDPSFLAMHPCGEVLYAACERPESTVLAFAVEPDGTLRRLAERSSGGSSLCHLAADPAGRLLMGANYGSGSVAVWPLGADGVPGEARQVIGHAGAGADPKRQAGPHAHSVTVSPDGRFALAADLGIDRVMVYRLDAEAGRLAPNDPPGLAVAPGSGPRHMAFATHGRRAYLVHELASALSVLAWEPAGGTLREVQRLSTLPAGFDGPSTAADVHAAPSGRFVYASNRGHDSIAVFAVEPAGGALECVGHVPTGGRTPRNFALDASGRWLVAANQDGDNLVVFTVDERTGLPGPTGGERPLGAPVCVLPVEPTRGKDADAPGAP